MADQEQQPSLASAFPNPPSFWREFTPDRIARIEELRKRYTAAVTDTTNPMVEGIEGEGLTLRVLEDVPEDLVHLQPPAEPEDGRWRVFGDLYKLNDELPTLEEQGILNLPPTHPSRKDNTTTTTTNTTATTTEPASPSKDQPYTDRALELKRLVKSLLLNFLELTGTLGQSPLHADAKVADLRTLLINVHHALNEYRPHQARESAAEMMQEHLDRTRRETVAIRSQVDRARRVLEGLGSLSVPAAGEGGEKKKEEEIRRVEEEEGVIDWGKVAVERERELWRATDVAFA